jgi:hypothetical protein
MSSARRNARETDACRRTICRHLERRGLGELPRARRNFELIEVQLAVRWSVEPQALHGSLHFPRTPAAPSDLSAGLGASGTRSYTFYRPNLTRLHEGLWLAVNLLDI